MKQTFTKRPVATFNKKVIAVAITTALSAGFSGAAFAQEDVEEIVVTGIRASIQNATNIKREASGVVDAISSEDIGKMPDANLAESLQRISGISIDRSNGEGAKITSRGFGPQFNLVTVNGRQLPATSIGEGYDVDGSRSFDMSNIASESVSGVDVYKTGKAFTPSGGIGATVNLKTAKPFDHEGFKATVGGKALMDQSVDNGDKVTPELSGFASWSNDVYGASLSLVRQERSSARSGFETQGWHSKFKKYEGPSLFVSTTPADIRQINTPEKGMLAATTNGMQYFHSDSTRTRDNALLTLQYKPSDKVTTTLEYLTTTTKAKSQEAIYSYWFDDSEFPATDVLWDSGNVVKTPIYFWTEKTLDPNKSNTRDIALKNSMRSNKNSLEDIAINVAYEATDELSFDFDAHSASSKATPWGLPGSNVTIGIGSQGVSAQGWDFSGDLPLMVGVYDDVNNKKLDKADVGSTVMQLVNARTQADVDEAKVSGKYKFDETSSIDFGLSTLRTESIQKKSDIGDKLMKGGWSVATPGDVPANLMEEINFANYFGGYRTNLTPQSREFFNASGLRGKDAVLQMTGFRLTNFDAVAKKLANDAGFAYAANPADSLDRKLNEETNAAFVQTNLEASLGETKVDIVAGLRYESTDVESASRVLPRRIEWHGNNDFNSVAVGDISKAPYVVSKYDYDNILPSIDLTFHLSEELIARASSSKTIARASYADLAQGAAPAAPSGGPVLIGGKNGAVEDGNVKLKPIESNNIDLSMEYYFDSMSYVSVGYFNKRVPNFIGKAQETRVFAGTLDPSAGPRVKAALEELKKQGLTVGMDNLFQMVGSMNDENKGCVNKAGTAEPLCGKPFNSANYETWENTVDILAVAGDPNIVNDVLTPVNSKDAEISGMEFSGQYFFGDTGFGLQANYTFVNGSIKYDVTAAPGTTQFPLLGLSDTANLVAIYEKDQWQARIAYNWRDKFLNNANVGNGEPEFTEDYSQIDFNLGYKVTDNFTVAFEGTNLLGEDKKVYGRTENQVRKIDILDSRYALSARYNF